MTEINKETQTEKYDETFQTTTKKYSKRKKKSIGKRNNKHKKIGKNILNVIQYNFMVFIRLIDHIHYREPCIYQNPKFIKQECY